MKPMTKNFLNNLAPEHRAELESFFKGFEFKSVSVVIREEIPRGESDVDEFYYKFIADNLQLDTLFYSGDRMHAIFTSNPAEDNVFYIFSFAPIGDIEERIIFKIIC